MRCPVSFSVVDVAGHTSNIRKGVSSACPVRSDLPYKRPSLYWRKVIWVTVSCCSTLILRMISAVPGSGGYRYIPVLPQLSNLNIYHNSLFRCRPIIEKRIEFLRLNRGELMFSFLLFLFLVKVLDVKSPPLTITI